MDTFESSTASGSVFDEEVALPTLADSPLFASSSVASSGLLRGLPTGSSVDSYDMIGGFRGSGSSNLFKESTSAAGTAKSLNRLIAYPIRTHSRSFRAFSFCFSFSFSFFSRKKAWKQLNVELEEEKKEQIETERKREFMLLLRLLLLLLLRKECITPNKNRYILCSREQNKRVKMNKKER